MATLSNQFPEHRYVGDKRRQIVYDLQSDVSEDVLAELAESEQFACFAPDTLAEARNRGYRLAAGAATVAEAAAGTEAADAAGSS